MSTVTEDERRNASLYGLFIWVWTLIGMILLTTFAGVLVKLAIRKVFGD